MSPKWILITIAATMVLAAFLFYKVATPDSSYESFLNKLQKDCPDYEPNGVRYRECLLNLVEQRSNDIAEQYQQLIAELDANTEPEFLTARQTFIQHLAELYATRQTYRDQYCIAQADSYWGGSDQGGEFNRCRLYEIEKYMMQLKQFREDWL